MRENNIAKLGCGIAISAFATFVTVGAAHADWTNPNVEAGISGPGYFTNLGSGGKSPEFDRSQYSMVNLGPLSATLWALKPGAQGPMRDDEADRIAMQNRDLESRLGPVGGRNTP
jgi:hypothetical protein